MSHMGQIHAIQHSTYWPDMWDELISGLSALNCSKPLHSLKQTKYYHPSWLHGIISFRHRRFPNQHQAVRPDTLVAVAPCDGCSHWVWYGELHRIDIDVVVSATMHLRKPYFLCHFAHKYLIILSFCKDFECKGSQKDRNNQEILPLCLQKNGINIILYSIQP